MATRGREANQLYVDTTHHPDRGTSHDNLPETDPLTTLRGVLTNGAADVSALQTRTDDAAGDTSPTQVAAEGAALEALARERRYTTALLAAGYTSEDIQGAKDADQWRHLMVQFTGVERCGLDPASAAHAGPSSLPLVELGDALAQFSERNHVEQGKVDRPFLRNAPFGPPTARGEFF